MNNPAAVFFYLPSCSTCMSVMKNAGITTDHFSFRDIKTTPLSAAELDRMKKMAGSYEALFSRRAILYRELGLKDRVLTEADYRHFLLSEYTFLKRPVVIIGEKIFAGSEKKNIAALMAEIRLKAR